MDVVKQVEQLTAHIKDPVEKARKARTLARALALVEVEPTEPLAEDDGRHDGIPIVNKSDMDAKEGVRLEVLKANRVTIFELEDEPEKVLTAEELLNKRGKFGYTPLIKAVVEQDVSSVRQLLDRGADVDLKDCGGMTALEKARIAGDRKIVTLLKQYGA